MAGNFRFEPTTRGGMPLPGADRQTYVTWALLAINILYWIVVENAGDSEDPKTLLEFGAMFGPLITSGEYWRLFTAMFLHVGIMHLLFNGFGLFIFGRLVERIYGPVRFTIIYILAGLSGSVASFWLNSIAIGAGASGAIFGVLAALAAFFIARRDVLGEMGRQNLVGILVLAAINLVFGFIQPGIDNWAHLGGFAGGFAVGLAFAPRYERREVADRFGLDYRLTDTNPLIRRIWVVPLALAVLAVGVWLGISAKPDDSVAITHLHRAEGLIEQEDYKAALAEIDAAMDLDPTNGQSFYLRGKIRLAIRDYRGARADLGAAIQLGLDDDESRRDAVALLVSLSQGR